MPIRILADLHHADLFYSYHLLFERRFGFEVYAPTGMEWFHQDYWVHERAVHGDKIARQYLEPYPTDIDCGDHWERPAFAHPDYMMKMVTLEQVRAMRPEIVLCSLVHNEPGYRRLATELGAKFGIQVGNILTPNNFAVADFALMSATFTTPPSCPHVLYHQEFDLSEFRFEYPPSDRTLAGCWVHSFYWTQWQEPYLALAQAVPELRWECYGHKDDNPYWRASLSPCSEVARSMRSARVAFHAKTWGDGYGHVIHTVIACGKPVIATASYYQSQLAGPLLQDGVNCIDIQRHSLDEVIAYAKRLAVDDEFHRQQSEASYRLFRKNVDFDEDAEKVKRLLEGVL